MNPKMKSLQIHWLLNHSQSMKWLLIFLFSTLIGLANFNRFTTNELAEGKSPPINKIFINEMTGAYSILVLLPVLFWFFRKFPLRRKNLLARLPVYVLVSGIFGMSHTLLMFLSRKAIYWLVLSVNYDYGHLGYRFVMEYNHQVITFWLIYGVVYVVGAFRENQKQKLRTSQLEEQLTKARLQALQMQLNPHFLFNTLNMISSTMYDNVDAADKMLARLSDLLRLTLNRANVQEHALEKEIELIDLYVEIMKARFDDKLQVKTTIDEVTSQALVPGFILQPLVENSILHSIEAVQSAEIEIVSRKENGKLFLSVTDNGPGIADTGDQAVRNGIGLTNTVERLEKLYGEKHKFSMHNANGHGLEVVIEIPFRVV